MTCLPAHIRSASRAAGAAFLLAVIALLTYAGSLDAPFALDDFVHIMDNSPVRVTRWTPEAVVRILNSRHNHRPLASLSFAANYSLHGYDVRGYHAVNLAIHIITALLVFLVARLTLPLAGAESGLIPFLAAVLWLVNPVHTQSVTYIVQRMNSLAALFYLLAMYSYIRGRITDAAGGGRGRKALFYVLCLIAGLLGMASKQTVATLPVMLFLYEWFFFQNLDRAWLKKQLPWIGLATVIGAFIVILLMDGSPLKAIAATYAKQKFTPGQRLLTQPLVIVYYVSLLLFPHPSRLALVYDFPLSTALTDPVATVPALAALLALVTGAVYAAGKHRLPAFAVLWFLINLAIESSVVGLALVYEHRTYLPSVFPVIVLAWLVCSRVRPLAIAVSLLCAAIAIGGLWANRRNTVWADPIRFWRDAVHKAPGQAMAYNNLGYALLRNGNPVQAMAPLARGVELDPLYPDIHANLAIACHLTGDTDQALDHCRRALDIQPDFAGARITLGFILRERGDLGQAEACFNRVLTTAPDHFEALLNMGLIEQQRGSAPNALPWFQKAVTVNPAGSKGYYYLGVCLSLCDRPAEAAEAFRKALNLDAHDYQTHCELAAVLLRGGNTEGAIDHYERALAIAPGCAAASIPLARARLQKGETAEAVACLKAVVQRSPGNPALLWQVVLMLTEAGRIGEATGYLESLIALQPDDPKLLYNLACLYARGNDRDRAVERLRQAVAKGYCNWPHLRADKDLENIRDTPYYQSLTR